MPLTVDQIERLIVFLGTVDPTSDARDADGAAYLAELGVPTASAAELFRMLRTAYAAGLQSAKAEDDHAPPTNPDAAALWHAGRDQATSEQRVARLVGGSVLVTALVGLIVMIVVLLLKWV